MELVTFSYVLFHFCAVVYGLEQPFAYELYSKNEINGNVIFDFDTNSVQACVALCEDTNGCLSVNFHKENGKCKFTDYYPLDETKSGKPEEGWKIYFRRNLFVSFYCPDKLYNYGLHDLYAKGVRIDSKTSIIFQTKGSNDAHVLLQESRTDINNSIVEICIGGWSNGKSVIKNRRQGPILAQYEGAVLNPESYTWFWISWDGGCVQVGKGSAVGSDRMMEWCGLTYSFAGIGISYGYGSDGYFRFPTNG